MLIRLSDYPLILVIGPAPRFRRVAPRPRARSGGGGRRPGCLLYTSTEGDVRYRYAEWRRWAEWKAREDYDGPLPWSALDRDGRVRRIAAVAAETMPKQHVGRIVEACAKASRSEDEFIRRVRREGFSIDPRLRKGAARDSFDSPDQVVGYRITWRSRDGWTERFNASDRCV